MGEASTLRTSSRSRFSVLFPLCALLGAAQATSLAAATGKKVKAPPAGDAAKPSGTVAVKSVYDFALPAADGASVPLSRFQGRTILIVNLARDSSYNDQLAGLSKLDQDFAARGLTVIGVPSNDFGSEEPGSDTDVAKFYEAKKLGFPVMARSSLRGTTELPLFTFLTTGKDVPAGGEVHWNFTKFLIDSKGKVVTRFGPDVSPDSPELRATVQQVLDGTYTGPKQSEPPASGEEDDDEGM